MDLTTNRVVVNDAIKYVQNKLDHLNNIEKESLQDIKQQKEEDNTRQGEEGQEDTEQQQQQKTNNDVF
jgi:hypothetical protein